MATLRDPATGCPWDVKQDFASIAPYTIEEAYEVADAIESGDRAALCDELGDLLLQVVFHARIAEELIDKMHEEAGELTAELETTPRDNQRITDEVGDLLFVAVNLARKAGVDPETALIVCNKKFENRFNYIEQNSDKKQKSINECDLEEMEQLWQEAKTARR